MDVCHCILQENFSSNVQTVLLPLPMPTKLGVGVARGGFFFLWTDELALAPGGGTSPGCGATGPTPEGVPRLHTAWGGYSTLPGRDAGRPAVPPRSGAARALALLGGAVVTPASVPRT